MAEFETFSGSGTIPAGADEQDVPCARCYASGRATVVMLPAETTCPESWTMVSVIAIVPRRHSRVNIS